MQQEGFIGMGAETGSVPPEAQMYEAPSSQVNDGQEKPTEGLDNEAESADSSSKAESADTAAEAVEPIRENPEATKAEAIRLARDRGLPNEALLRLDSATINQVLDLEARINNSSYEKTAAELLVDGAKELSDKPRLAEDGYTVDNLALETYATWRDAAVQKHKKDVWEVTGFKGLPREYQSQIGAEASNLEATAQRHSAKIAELESKLADGESAGLDSQTKVNLERRLVVEKAMRNEAEAVLAVLRENT